MLLCCAGICGGHVDARAPASPADALAAPEQKLVVKPVVRLDEPEYPQPASFDILIESFGMLPAPPGASQPGALVSPDFQQNSVRLLVVVPSSGTPPGAWDSQDTAAPLLLWAQANSYAVALFSARSLEAAPEDFWDRILKGSPARFVAVVIGNGMLPIVQAALAPLHPLLISRFRAICVACEGNDIHGLAKLLTQGQPMSEQLRNHFSGALMPLPSESRGSAPYMAHQGLFETLLAREERWSRIEAKKYAGFQNLKENDKPGLKRMSVEKRIERLDRDRGNDELARLLRKHEKQAAGAPESDEEEPGVD